MKKMKKIIFLQLICITSLVAFSQTPTFTTYTQSTGNWSEDDLTDIEFDKTTNVVWVGSRYYDAPLKKFDGVNWTNYTATVYNAVPGEVTSMVIDKAHNIWYSTFGGGISKYNGSSFTNYTTSNSGLANNFVPCITTDNGNNLFLYASNMHQTQKFTGSSWTTLESFSYGEKMCFDSTNNRVWMATQGSGLKKIQGSTITTYNTSNSNIPNDDVKSVTVDNNGIVWLTFNDASSGLFKFDGTTWTQYTSSNSGLLNTNYIGVVKSDKKGNIWIGGYSYQGLTKFNGTTWTSYNIAYPNFPSTNIKDFTFGNNNIVWIATGNGLVKMQLPVGISEVNDKSNNVKLYPNPFSNNATITIDDKIKLNMASVVIYDVVGKEIKRINNITSNTITIEKAEMPNGIYFYKVINYEAAIATGKFIVE